MEDLRTTRRNAFGARLDTAGMIQPVRRATGPGALLYLEDDELVGDRVIQAWLAPRLPNVEIVWVTHMDAAREAIWRSPRIGGFLLDFLIHGETCEGLLALVRQAYPPPTPVHILTGYGDEAWIARFAAAHDAVLIEKGAGADFGRLVDELAESRRRVLATREALSAMASERLSPREMQIAELYAARVPRERIPGAMGPAVNDGYFRSLTASVTRKLRCVSLDDIAEKLASRLRGPR